MGMIFGYGVAGLGLGIIVTLLGVILVVLDSSIIKKIKKEPTKIDFLIVIFIGSLSLFLLIKGITLTYKSFIIVNSILNY